jgi:hypothetical protein
MGPCPPPTCKRQTPKRWRANVNPEPNVDPKQPNSHHCGPGTPRPGLANTVAPALVPRLSVLVHSAVQCQLRALPFTLTHYFCCIHPHQCSPSSSPSSTLSLDEQSTSPWSLLPSLRPINLTSTCQLAPTASVRFCFVTYNKSLASTTNSLLASNLCTTNLCILSITFISHDFCLSRRLFWHLKPPRQVSTPYRIPRAKAVYEGYPSILSLFLKTS